MRRRSRSGAERLRPAETGGVSRLGGERAAGMAGGAPRRRSRSGLNRTVREPADQASSGPSHSLVAGTLAGNHAISGQSGRSPCTATPVGRCILRWSARELAEPRSVDAYVVDVALTYKRDSLPVR